MRFWQWSALLVVLLAVAAPSAGASSRERRSTSLTFRLVLPKTLSQPPAHTCQAQEKGHGATSSGLVGMAKKFDVVACEQPPRSELIGSHSLVASNASVVSSEG